MPIPEAIQALTPATLTEILTAGGQLDGRVVAVVAEPLEVGSAVSDLARLRLEYQAARPGPATIIGKFAGESEGKRALEAVLHFWARECWILRAVIPTVPLATPAVYHAGEDVPAILLEDLDAHRRADQVAGLSVADAERVIDDLAVLHAAYWESPQLETFESLLRYDDPILSVGLGATVASGADGLERYRGRVDARTIAAARQIGRHFGEILPGFADGPPTLIHNDCRADNLFFDDDRPIWIDWQGAAVAWGPHDVAYLIAGSLTIADTDAHWERLLGRYHRGLTDRGVTYGWEDCLRHYRRSIVYALAPSLAVLGSLAIDSDGGSELTDAMVTRTLAHAQRVAAFDCV